MLRRGPEKGSEDGTMTRGNSKKLEDILRLLARNVNTLVFSEPVRFVYNPLDYAWAAQKIYLERYGQGKKEAIFLGMNPGHSAWPRPACRSARSPAFVAGSVSKRRSRSRQENIQNVPSTASLASEAR